MWVVILGMHFLRAYLSQDSFLCSGNPEAHAKDTEGFQSFFTQQVLPKNLSKVGNFNGNSNETDANTLVSSVIAILTPPLMITNLNLTQAHLYRLQPMHDRLIYNERDTAAGGEELSFLNSGWHDAICSLSFPYFQKEMCQRWWGAALIWTEETLPTFTWKAARGDLEVSRYKALVRQMVLPSEILPEIPISLVPGLFARVLTHRIKLCNAYCISACSRLLWLLLISAHASLLESWLLSFTYCCSASKTASRFRPQEASSGISSAVTAVEWVWQFTVQILWTVIQA